MRWTGGEVAWSDPLTSGPPAPAADRTCLNGPLPSPQAARARIDATRIRRCDFIEPSTQAFPENQRGGGHGTARSPIMCSGLWTKNSIATAARHTDPAVIL